MGLTFEAWKHQKVNLTRARKYLSQVNASQRVKQYHEWKEIGQALYAIDCKIGLELWKTWTQEHLGPHSCVQEWKTFMPRTSADQLSLHELQHESTRFSNSLVLYRQEQGPEQDRDFRIHLKDQLYRTSNTFVYIHCLPPNTSVRASVRLDSTLEAAMVCDCLD